MPDFACGSVDPISAAFVLRRLSAQLTHQSGCLVCAPHPLIIPAYRNSGKKSNKNHHSEMIGHEGFCAEKDPKPLLVWFLQGMRLT